MYVLGATRSKYRRRAWLRASRPVLLLMAVSFTGITSYNLLGQSSAVSRGELRTADKPQPTQAGTVAGSAVVRNETRVGAGAAGRAQVLFGQIMPTADGLQHASKKEIAMRLVSSAENSSLDWRGQFGYIEDIGDGRGYTAGIIGFCSGTGDMLALVEHYTRLKPDNLLAKYLPALRQVNGTASHAGLGQPFVNDWKTAAGDGLFRQAQETERDRVYFDPAVKLAQADGLGTLGQFIFYDAAVMHGPDAWGGGLPDIRARVIQKTRPPAQGGDETAYLNDFLDARKAEMLKEAAHSDVSRIETAQRRFLAEKNFGLNPPLRWSVYGDPYVITDKP